MKNFLAVLFIIVVVGLSITYIIKQKKSGVKCIGCPNKKECEGKNSCSNCEKYI